MVLTAIGHKPEGLGGYSLDNFVNLLAFAIEIIPALEPTKIISCMSIGWDQAVALAAIELGIPLIAAIPFVGQESLWSEKYQALYHSILDKAEEVTPISKGIFQIGKYNIALKKVISQSDGALVMFDPKIVVNTLKSMVEYAESKNKSIYNVWEKYQEWTKGMSFETFRSEMLELCIL